MTPPTPTPPKSLSEFVASAPHNFQEILNEGLAVLDARRGELIKQLRSTNRCDFTDDELMHLPVKRLEGLVKLAGVETPAKPVPAEPGDFSGRAAPAALSAGKNDMFAPPAPDVFTKKVAS